GSTFPVGTTPVEVIATDASGNADTCYFNVTINDTEPPVAQCPDDITQNNDQGLCSAVVSFTIDATDNCPGVSVSSSPVSGSTFPVGATTPVEVIATDASGNADTCYFDVTVNDTEPPAAQCPGDITVAVDPGECTAAVSFSIDAADNCPGVTVAADPPSGSTFSLGLTTVKVIAVDAAGNADTCHFDVTVTNGPPVLTCPDNGSVHAGEDFVSSNFSVFDPENHMFSVTFLSIDPAATNNPAITPIHVEWTTTCDENGDYTICLEATDQCGAKDTCCFVVTVGNQPPDLSCPANDSAKVDSLFVSTDYSVYDPDDASGVTVTLHSITPAPVASPALVDNHVEWIPCPADWSIGPDFTVTLVATDPCGAAHTCSFVITVYNLPPIIDPPPDDSVHAGRYFVSEDFTVSDQKGPVTVAICGVSPPSVHTPTIADSHVELQTECSEAGMVYTICLEATDDCGAKDTGYFNVTVYNRPPDVVPPDNENVHAGDTYLSPTITATDPDVEPVDVTLLDVTPAPTNPAALVGDRVEWTTACEDEGDYLFILTAADSCGLTDTAEFTLTVYNEAPTLICPGDDSVHAGDYYVSADFSAADPDGDPVTVSLCGITPTPTNPPSIIANHVEWQTDCVDDGVFGICLVAVDSCGEDDTCYFEVMVYNQPPVLDCAANGIVTPGSTFVSGSFSFSDPDGDEAEVFFVAIAPPTTNDPIIVGDHVEWISTSSETGTYVITLGAVDSCECDTVECDFYVTVTEPSEYCTNVLIPEIDCVNPGEYVCIPILLDNNTTPFGGFELEVEFDYTSMTLVSAEPGEAIEGFEKFTYRLLPCPLCGCCKYKILLYGQYDLPNGVENIGTPIPVTPEGVYQELVNLCFVVNNNENLRGLTIPVCFEWEGTVEDNILIEDWNCEENTFSSWSGDTLFTSDLLCQFRADLCDDPSDRIQPELCFQHHICGDNCGGIQVCPAGPGDCKRGDVNMNTITYEVADAVLFASYFVQGTVVFRYDLAYQICA
ncbi:MAG: HYR domain-containing protein, partial [Candidatus Zixiibacteriota bacterium]